MNLINKHLIKIATINDAINNFLTETKQDNTFQTILKTNITDEQIKKMSQNIREHKLNQDEASKYIDKLIDTGKQYISLLESTNKDINNYISTIKTNILTLQKCQTELLTTPVKYKLNEKYPGYNPDTVA